MAHSKPLARAVDLSPLVIEVVHAIAHQVNRGSNFTGGDHLAALMELAGLARLSVPARGVGAWDDFRFDIERIADRHLRRRAAEKEFIAAIERVKSRDKRDAIDSAHLQIVELSELAHYYAGLTSGLTLADLSRK